MQNVIPSVIPRVVTHLYPMIAVENAFLAPIQHEPDSDEGLVNQSIERDGDTLTNTIIKSARGFVRSAGSEPRNPMERCPVA